MEKAKEFLLHPVFISIIALFVIGVILYYLVINVPEVPSAERVIHFKGKEDSKIVITEYTDFQCPACKDFFATKKQIIEKYGNYIKFEVRHFPLNTIHPNAQRAAEAAEAAGAQGKFFEYSEILFERQGESQNWNTEKFVEYAREVGVNDIDRFRKELVNRYYQKAVIESLNEAQSKGFTGTPTVLINGRVYELNGRPSVPSYSELESEILKLAKEYGIEIKTDGSSQNTGNNNISPTVTESTEQKIENNQNNTQTE